MPLSPHLEVCGGTVSSKSAYCVGGHLRLGPPPQTLVGVDGLSSPPIGFCSINQSTFEELCVDADGRLFRTILSNSDHLLAQFLPDKSVAFQNYHLRWRPHNLILPQRLTHLTDCNYINRMLYLNSYLPVQFSVFIYGLRYVKTKIDEYSILFYSIVASTVRHPSCEKHEEVRK